MKWSCREQGYCKIVCGYDLIDDFLYKTSDKRLGDLTPTERLEVIQLLRVHGAKCDTSVYGGWGWR